MGRDNVALLFAACLIFGVWLIGGFLGTNMTLAQPDPGSLVQGTNFLTFGWDGLKFLVSLATFQLSSVPWWLSGFFDLIVVGLCLIVPVLNWVRGRSG